MRLGDVARVEVGPANDRSELRANGVPTIGLGVSAQAKANVLDTARSVKAELARMSSGLPEGMEIVAGYDASIYIEQAIFEVYKTLLVATGLVVLVIYLFLGSFRAMLVPALTVPVSLTAAFIVLWAMGFSVNLLTLLALVLSIGLVVDDAIVVLENVYRRVEAGEPPLLAAYRGARQVGFAVIATTLVLVAVFVPIAFMEGNLGRLFSEFSLAIAGAVCFSSLVALTLVPMAASKLLRPAGERAGPAALVDQAFSLFSRTYSHSLGGLLRGPLWVSGFLLAVVAGGWQLFTSLPQEYAPTEDRSSFFVIMNAPEGASFEYTQRYARDMENVLLPLLDKGEAYRVLISTPLFGSGASVNNSIAIVSLENWDQRERSTQEIVGGLFPSLMGMPGVRAFPIQPAALGQRGFSTPVQFVLGGDTYEALAEWRDAFLGKASENPKLLNLDADYKEVKPQLLIQVDRNRAADLGVSVSQVGRTLETMLGSRRVTTYLDRGEEYDVILQAEDADRRTPGDIENLYVRAAKSGELVPLSSLVTVSEGADAATLNRFNRLRSITISANLAPGYTLGEALTFLRGIAEETLPTEARIDYKGQSRELPGILQQRARHLQPCPARGLPGAGGAVRELHSPPRHHAYRPPGGGGGAPGFGAERRFAEYLQPDRNRHDGGAGREERHFDRGVCESASRRGGFGGGGHQGSGAAAPPAHRNDVHLHSDWGTAPDPRRRRWGGEPHGHWRGGLCRRALFQPC